MVKPWARIEVGYLTHPKFLALNANAICLWHEGKNYCDTHHTDGIIPKDALRTFRFRGVTSLAMLMTSCGQKPDGTPYAPLWEPHALGYKMHDYLDHNDCREAVLARLEQADRNRELDREYKRRARAAKQSKRDVYPVNVRSGHEPDCPADVRLYTETSTTPQPPSGGLSANPPPTFVVDQALADRAGVFIERYTAIYAKTRNGAFYRSKPVRDYGYACELVQGWSDMDYLEKMAELFLLRSEWKPKNEPGTMGQFLHLAPQCDAMLRQHGHGPRGSKVAS